MAVTINVLNAGNMTLGSGGSTPSGHAKTIITLNDDSTVEYEWSGTLTKSMFEDIGLWTGAENWDVNSPMDTIDIGNTITSIEHDTFVECNRLMGVTIPDSVTSIGDYAFRYCGSLTSVTIGNGVTSIGAGAFMGCYALTAITIAKNKNDVKTLGLDYIDQPAGEEEMYIFCSDGTLTIGFNDMGEAYWKED